jgi:hypothetical protein
MVTRRRPTSRIAGLLVVGGLAATLTAGLGMMVAAVLIAPAPSSAACPP